MSVRILLGDCVERLRDLSDNSVDSVVTDPPYHLTSIVKRFGSPDAAPAQSKQSGVYARSSKGFMGQTWDGGDVAFRPETWVEILRVLKPGGHLLAFSGTRTYHRMAVAIEDAGFEVRDMIAWHYASGFPKSLDISKAIDKRAKVRVDASEVRNPKATGGGRDGTPGATRPWIEEALKRGYHEKDSDEPATDSAKQWQGYGTALKPATEPICLARKPISESSIAANVLRWGTGALNIAACRISADVPDPAQPTSQDAARNSQPDSTADTFPSREVCPQCRNGRTDNLALLEPERAGRNGPPANASAHDLGNPQPLGSLVDCPTCHGYGGGPVRADLTDGQASLLQPLDVDSARAPDAAGGRSRDGLSKPCEEDTTPDIQRQYIPNGKNNVYGDNMGGDWSLAPDGRWPANLVHDGSDEVVAGFPNAPGQMATVKGTEPSSPFARVYGDMPNRAGSAEPRGDFGSAARFFYCAKATTEERGEGNNHPTVKPVELMRWLVRLVTPKGGTVLDPFMGSGSTALACDAEQFNFIGCELSADYVAIAEQRIRKASGLFADVSIEHTGPDTRVA